MQTRQLCLQVVKGLRGGVQDVALKMLLGDTHYHVNSFRQVNTAATVAGSVPFPQFAQLKSQFGPVKHLVSL